MATKTFVVSKQYMAEHVVSGAANPGDGHMPIGHWAAGTGLSWVTRANVYAPISFTGMTGINQARLYLYQHTSAGFHAKGSGTVGVATRRKTGDWSETSGGVSSAIDEVWSGNGATYVESYIWNDSDPTANVSNSAANENLIYIDITNCVTAWFNGSSNYGVMIFALSTAESEACEFYSRHASGRQPYIWIDYESNTAPNAPTNLSPSSGSVKNTGTSITVSGTRSDPDSGDYITGVAIYMYTTGGTLVDSDTYYPSGTPTTFSRTLTVPSANEDYKYKVRTRDRENVWGPYSSLITFTANTIPDSPTVSIQETPTTAIKTLTPTFNITRRDADSTNGDTMDAYQINLEGVGLGGAPNTNVWDSGAIAAAAGTTSVQKLYNGPALSWQTQYEWQARTRDVNGAWGPYSAMQPFATLTAGVPISLSPTGNVVTSTLTPALIGSRSSTAYTIASYQIELYESNGTTLKWASGTLSTGISGGASFSKTYNGAALSYGTQYKWRARVTGNIGGTSAWSGLQTFTTRASTEVEQTAPVGTGISDLTPNFTGTWTDSLNARQIILYAEDGTTQIWDSGQDTQTSATSFTTTYDGTALAYNTTYQWKVRVRRTSDSVWQPYSGLVSFTTDTAQQPVLTSPINNSWQTALTPTFTGTTQAAETISTYRILLYEADGVTLKWDSGDLAGSGTSFSKLYNGGSLVAGRTYKWQARYVKTGGAVGSYSALEDFHINIAPSQPTNLVPAEGAVIADTLTPTFSATFVDDDAGPWGDVPNRMEIEVRNNATDALIATQNITVGLVAGTNSITWDGVPALAYETTYKWRVRYRDSKSFDGAWSSYSTFKPSQSSTVDITSPTTDIESPQVHVTWNFSSPASKDQAWYQVQIARTDDEIMVYDSGQVLSDSTEHIVPAGYLQNTVGYTFVVTVVDEDGI